jgi:hypothetical protein
MYSNRTISSLIVASLIFTGLGVSNSNASSLGGVLSSDTVLTKADSPYLITATIQVPKGITLKVEAGVTFTSGNLSELFLVAGTLELNGSSENPIRIQGIKSDYIFRSLGDNPKISITSTLFSDIGSLWKNDAAKDQAIFRLENSEVINSKGGVYVWFPKIFTLKGNYFFNSGGFSIGIGRCYQGSESNEDIQVSSNTFEGRAGSTVLSEGWIVGWVTSCDERIVVRGNYFKSPTGAVISVPKNYSQPINIAASDNFWDTTNSSQISNYILDSTDSIEYMHKVLVSSSLDAIPAGAPLASKVVAEQKLLVEKALSDKAAADKAAADKAALGKKSTVTCSKGKLIKKVTGLSPKCPSGYKKK